MVTNIWAISESPIFSFILQLFILEKEWQPTPVFLPGESHRRRSLVGYGPRGCKESDTTIYISSYLYPIQLHLKHFVGGSFFCLHPYIEETRGTQEVTSGCARGNTVGAQRLGKVEKEEGRGKTLAKDPFLTGVSRFYPCNKNQHAWPPSKTLAYVQTCLFPLVPLSIGNISWPFLTETILAKIQTAKKELYLISFKIHTFLHLNISKIRIYTTVSGILQL